MATGRLPDPPLPPAPDTSRWRQEFPGRVQELSQVRRWLERLLPERPARDDVLSVTVELCSNALQHTASGKPGGSFTVEVSWQRSTVHIAVIDGGSQSEPRMIDDLDEERGRGLLLVHGLSARTGWSGDEHGRVVCAEVAWPGTSSAIPAPSGVAGHASPIDPPALRDWPPMNLFERPVPAGKGVAR
jgi:anti-sigma regulatory factor (Ser/Thr protein kinase)